MTDKRRVTCPHVEAVDPAQWSPATIREGICPTCMVALERRESYGYCPCCESGWAVSNDQVTLVIVEGPGPRP